MAVERDESAGRNCCHVEPCRCAGGELGRVRVVVTNSLGTARSPGATLTLSNSAPIILTQPASLAVRLGAGAAFSVVAAGPSPFGYQWQFKGTNIAGATQATLSLTNVTAASFGSYRAAVSNTFGVTFSSNAVLGRRLPWWWPGAITPMARRMFPRGWVPQSP